MVVLSVTKEDCGELEGANTAPLHDAVKEVCPGYEGDVLWEKIRDKFALGIVDCDSWVSNMNHAIAIWNLSNPKSCAEVKAAYMV